MQENSRRGGGTENPCIGSSLLCGAHGLANTSFWHQNIRFSNSGFSNRDIRGGGVSWECRGVDKVFGRRDREREREKYHQHPQFVSVPVFVSVSISVFVSVFAHVFISVFVSVFVSAFVSVFESEFVHVSISVFVSVFVSMFVFVSVFESVFESVFVSVFVSLPVSVFVSVFVFETEGERGAAGAPHPPLAQIQN